MAVTAALEVDVPTARSTVFSPLAEAVSVMGTERIDQARDRGVADRGSPGDDRGADHDLPDRVGEEDRPRYPRARTPHPTSRVVLAPYRRVIRADAGAEATIAKPPGTMYSPASTTLARSPRASSRLVRATDNSTAPR
jgi:hypothetical protein